MISGACDDYPYSHGDIEMNTEEEIKILATAHAAIHSDGVVGALVIAEVKAKRFLTAFSGRLLVAWLMYCQKRYQFR